MKKLLLILLCLPMIGFGQVWEKYFVSDYSSALSVKQTSDGGFIFAGGYGGIVWTQKFPGMLHSYGTSLQQTNDSGIVFCGFTSITDDVDDEQYAYLAKTDGNGNITSTFNIPINPNRELKKVTDLLGRETKQTNQPLFYIYDDGTVEKRIVIE